MSPRLFQWFLVLHSKADPCDRLNIGDIHHHQNINFKKLLILIPQDRLKGTDISGKNRMLAAIGQDNKRETYREKGGYKAI